MNKRKLLLLTLLLFAAAAITSPLMADSHYKVISWKFGDMQGSYETMPRQAVLVSTDCYLTPEGYGWDTNIIYAPEQINLLVDEDAVQINQQSDGEALVYYGEDNYGKPIIYYEYGGGINNPPAYIYLSPTPPCLELTASAWTLNGNAKTTITISDMKDLIMDARTTYTTNNKYFISVMKSDQNWGSQGPETMSWMTEGASPHYFSRYEYNLWKFFEVEHFQIVPGNYYRIKLAVSPWHSTSKLVYFPETVNQYNDLVPTMTSNTSPSGIASASSQYGSSYAPWRAFDGNDESASWSRWISSSSDSDPWLAYEFSSNKRATAYYILPEYGSTTKSRSPRTWKLEGWNGSTWTMLDYRSNILVDVHWSSKGLVFKTDKSGYYIKYRLKIYDGNGSSVISIRQLKLMNKDGISLPGDIDPIGKTR